MEFKFRVTVPRSNFSNEMKTEQPWSRIELPSLHMVFQFNVGMAFVLLNMQCKTQCKRGWVDEKSNGTPAIDPQDSIKILQGDTCSPRFSDIGRYREERKNYSEIPKIPGDLFRQIVFWESRNMRKIRRSCTWHCFVYWSSHNLLFINPKVSFQSFTFTVFVSMLQNPYFLWRKFASKISHEKPLGIKKTKIHFSVSNPKCNAGRIRYLLAMKCNWNVR